MDNASSIIHYTLCIEIRWIINNESYALFNRRTERIRYPFAVGFDVLDGALTTCADNGRGGVQLQNEFMRCAVMPRDAGGMYDTPLAKAPCGGVVGDSVRPLDHALDPVLDHVLDPVLDPVLI